MLDRGFWILLADDFFPVNFRSATWATWDSFWLKNLWQVPSWFAVDGSQQRYWVCLTESLVKTMVNKTLWRMVRELPTRQRGDK